jgi:membrane protein
MAAELSYYFLLGFFPFLIFLSDVITFSQIEPGLLGKILNELSRFFPEMTQGEIIEIVERARQKPGSAWVFSWMLVALWWASLGLNGTISVLNRAYRAREHRSFLSLQALAVVVTVGVSIFIILSGFLLFFGDDLNRFVATHLGFQPNSWGASIWSFGYSSLRWILILAFFNVGIQIMYYALPACRIPWRLISPGSVFASLGWFFGSVTFSIFVNQNPAYGRLYGSLKGLVVLMIWFYLSSLFLLVGGTMDSEIYLLRKKAKARKKRAQTLID